MTRTLSRLVPLGLGLAALLLLSGCETQSYPRQARSPAVSAPAAAPTSQSVPQGPPSTPVDESEVFLAVRELAQRGPSRSLRAAAFRYLDLTYSSGTLGAGQSYGSAGGLSAPVKVTAEDQQLAFDAIVEALRGLPQDADHQPGACLVAFEQCSSAGGDCDDRLLLCAARALVPSEADS